jgi:hypothetical protein
MTTAGRPSHPHPCNRIKKNFVSGNNGKINFGDRRRRRRIKAVSCDNGEMTELGEVGRVIMTARTQTYNKADNAGSSLIGESTQLP